MNAPWSTETPSSPRTTASRRKFLCTTCAIATTMVAGCSGDDDGDDSTPEPTVTTEPTETPTETPTEASTPTPTETDTAAGTDPDPPNLERRALEFLELLADGSFDAAHERFIQSTAAEVSVADLEQAWTQTTLGSGSFASIEAAEYEGTSNGLSQVTIDAEFEQAQNTFAVFLQAEGVEGFRLLSQNTYDWEPPAYTDESAFGETMVTLDATASCDLGGTLSIPDGDGPVPGVVIVHGSGPVDRDGTFGPNKPYKELAWGLASRGVAVLRYDKRTNACDVALSDVTIDDVATDDALTAIERLRDHDRVAADGVFVVGHSLGGVLAPHIATRDGSLAGAVMLAPGPARPMAETVLDQRRHLLDQQNVTDEEREEALAELQKTAEKIRTLDIGDDEVLLSLGGREYFRTLAEYDGPKTAAGLEIPLFLAMGGRDYQVTVENDLPIWREALSSASDVAIEVYDDLNHLFQQGEGPSTGREYYEPDAVFDRRVIEDVAAFVEQHA